MITYKTANNYPALIVGDRLQAELNFQHNANRPFCRRDTTIKHLERSYGAAIALFGLLYTHFDGITDDEANRLRAEIHATFDNAVALHRAKRGRPATA